MKLLWLAFGSFYLLAAEGTESPCFQPYASSFSSKQTYANPQRCFDLSSYSDEERQLFSNLEKIKSVLEPHVEEVSRLAYGKLAAAEIKEKFEPLRRGTPGFGHHLTTRLSYDQDDVAKLSKESKAAVYVAEELARILADEYNVKLPVAANILQFLNITVTKEGPCNEDVTCDPYSKYRTADGSCNNLINPTWGMARTAFERLLPPNYSNGISDPPVSVSGEPLPGARYLSSVLFPDKEKPDNVSLLALMQWGQFISHDNALSGSPESSASCCSSDGSHLPDDQLPTACLPIDIPADDPFYSKFNRRCMQFVRTVLAPSPDCSLGPAEQMGVVTHFWDGSMVYGSSVEQTNSLRSFIGGRLRTQVRNGYELPPQVGKPTEECDVDSDDDPCFMAGDERVNQNPQLTVMHIMFLREHNRVADELSRLNPNWDDERIFQETRRIVIAQIQHITYQEWLPVMMGHQYAKESDLYSEEPQFNDGYRDDINPSTLNDFTTSVFRYFHTLVQGNIGLPSTSGCPMMMLSDYYNRPSIVADPAMMDYMIEGMTIQESAGADEFFTTELTQYLFKSKNPFGNDMEAIDVQRGRDHGLSPYNDYRQLCGLPKATTFDDFADIISEENVEKLKSVYSDPNDVDFFIGGCLEERVSGALMGPTFHCIFMEQMYRLKYGDRFFYNVPDQPGSFTEEQLKEIFNARLSKLFCNHSGGLKIMPLNAFLQHNTENPLVDCEQVASIDLTKWSE